MGVEFAHILLAYMDLAMQALGNIMELLNSQTISFSNVWGIVYGGVVTNYHLAQAASELMQVTKNSAPALMNLSQAVNYLGSNATVIFGDLDGTRGIAGIQRRAVAVLLENSSVREALAEDFATMLRSVLEFTTKLLQSVENTFL